MNEKEKEDSRQEPFRGFSITFDVYAHNEQEVEDLRMAIVAFIGHHRRQGRAIDARRLAQAIANWDRNPIVKNQIINYFK